MSESEWTKILRWPGYRVHRNEINEEQKTLRLWVRRERGNRKLEYSGCGRKVQEIAEVYEREVRDLPWSEYRTTERLQQIAVVALPLFCLLSAEMVNASMFIASFVAGLAVQMPFKEAGEHSVEFAEEWGEIFNLAVFFMFGMVVVRDWTQLTPACWVYGILSLTVVRMLPVAIALIGTKLAQRLSSSWGGLARAGWRQSF